jgi:hypothetical protein
VQVDGDGKLSHDARMSIAAALRELMECERTQTSAAERITAHGLRTDQTKVSAWMRGARVPNVEQLAVIEEAFDRPRGWVLAQAGFVDPAALTATKPSGGDGNDASREHQIRALHAEVRQLRRALAAAEAEALQLREEAQSPPSPAQTRKPHTNSQRRK